MNNASQSSTVFESFNARALAPQQVAQTFVPPDSYLKLVRRRHSIVVGPRGSGKTTLLKMLQGPALEAWRHPAAEEYRRAIDFTGIFVPADRAWSAQIEALGGEGFAVEHRAVLGIAAFTTHVLRELIGAIEYRVHPPSIDTPAHHRRASLPIDKEVAFVKDLSSAWHIEPVRKSLMALKFALSDRLSQIMALGRRERLLPAEGRAERLATLAHLHLHFLSAAGLAIREFDDLADEGAAKWAFLFDELELAPKWIRDELFAGLRSTDDRFLFKLSLSPFSEDVPLLVDALGAMPGHDYETIPLWYPNKESGYDFCEALLKAMLAERGLPEVAPELVFGVSSFETPAVEWKAFGTAYRAGSRLQRRFASMAQKDHSFRRYLKEKQIRVDNLEGLAGDERAGDIRKITSLVAVRDTFRTSSETTEAGVIRHVRSRKNPKLYAGATSLFAMAEANPRWFIGIVSPLLDTVSSRRLRISESMQSREVEKTGARFRALLRTIPCPPISGRSTRGVLTILDAIGEFFFHEVVIADFNPDPVGSVIVDSHASAELLRSLSEALNAGAIVYVPDDSSELVLPSLRGKRFRLSYLLAPYYGLPIRLGRGIALSAVLPASLSTDQNGRQKGLFGDRVEK